MRCSSSLLLAALLLSASAASAQTTFRLGLRGGANLALTTLDPASSFSGSYANTYATSKPALLAGQAGLVAEVGFGKLALQPALLFSQKGERVVHTYDSYGAVSTDHYAITSTNRYNWLELPLHMVYTLRGTHGLQLFAGPYAAWAVGGHLQGDSALTTLPRGRQSTSFAKTIRYGPGTGNSRFDAGFNFGLGYRQGPVQVQLLYGLGLLNLHRPGADYAPSPAYYGAAYNRVAQLTGTYFFQR